VISHKSPSNPVPSARQGLYVEAVDVPALVTWERYMGGTHGWTNFPNRQPSMSPTGSGSDKHYETTLPGLANFCFCGVWATQIGELFMNAQFG
jgi:hypothetical protein